MSRVSDEDQSFDTPQFGVRVFQARKTLEARVHVDLTKEAMGERVGVSGATYGRWEKGEDKPNLDRLVRLAAVLGVEPAWLAFGVGPREASAARREGPPPIVAPLETKGDALPASQAAKKRRRPG